MPLPNFLIIGAGRSGTTSLHHYLRQHPDIFIPEAKAPSYFYCCDVPPVEDPYLHLITRNYFVPDRREYLALFDGVENEKAIGEVSPVYLATTRAASRIAGLIPSTKLVAIIRNPVERAYARFLGRSRDGLERRASFAEIVREEMAQGLLREDAHGTYVAGGFVFHYLESYLEHFRKESFHIRLFEDLKENSQELVSGIFEFLGVDCTFEPLLDRRHNPSSGIIRQPLLRYFWTHTGLVRARLRPFLPAGMRDAFFGALPLEAVDRPLEAGVKAELIELYRDDILKLQEWLDRDLSAWLE
jgi:hypothetical protein